MPIDVISKIKPINNGSFPVVEDIDIQGGYQVRSTTTDRDNIPTVSRKIGMLVFVQSDSTFYTLSGGITNSNWEIANLGGGSTVIFRPGIATSAPAFATWAEVVTDAYIASQSFGAVTIVFDGYFAACHITSGSWDFGPLTTFAGFHGFETVTIDDGATFVHTPVKYSYLDISSNSTTPVITSVPAEQFIACDQVVFGVSSAPLYSIDTEIFLDLNNTQLFGPPFIFESTNTLWVNAYGYTFASDSVFSTSVDLQYQIFSSAASLSPNQTTSILVSHGRENLDGYGLLSYGPTASRPNLAVWAPGHPGFRFFDTDLNKPIWWDGTKWIVSGNSATDYPGSSVGEQRVQGVSVTPGWTVMGGFKFFSSRIGGANSVTLEVILAPSTVALTARARIVDSLTLTPVTGSTITVNAGSINDQYVASGDLSGVLVDGALYQIQVECTGGALNTDFVTVRSGSLVVE